MCIQKRKWKFMKRDISLIIQFKEENYVYFHKIRSANYIYIKKNKSTLYLIFSE